MSRHAPGRGVKTSEGVARVARSVRDDSYSGESSTKGKQQGHRMFIAYDIREKKREGGMTMSPKVKPVHIAGVFRGWQFGSMRRKSGRLVHGIQITYEVSRSAYLHNAGASRHGQDNNRKRRKILTRRQVVEMPEDARNVHVYTDEEQLPEKYRAAMRQADKAFSRSRT